MVELSDAQRRIVEHQPQGGHLLVLAGPGSGKTFAIVERIRFLIEGGHAGAENVLVMAFTQQAAAELRDRLAVRGHAGATTGTFHHICARFLREHGDSIGVRAPLRTLDEREQAAVLTRAATQLDFPLGQRGAPSVLSLREHISRRKLAGLSPGDWPPGRARDRLADQIAALDERYDQLLRETDSLDFADLIVLGLHLLAEDPEAAGVLRRRFRFVFVDEFHDLSPDQFELLRRIAPPRGDAIDAPQQVMAVADPDQAIFGWRQADPDRMLAVLRRNYRPAVYSLRDNFRSTLPIIRAAGALRLNGRSAPSDPSMEHDLPVICIGFSNELHEANALAKLIERAQAIRGYDLDDIAILYRSHRRADLAEAALLRAGVPIRRVQPDRFFDQPDVQESLRYLDLVASLTDPAFEPALNWPRVLVDELTMLHLRRLARDRGSTLAELADAIEDAGEAVSPLTRVAIQDFRDGIASELRPLANAPLATIVECLLALLARRRNPIPTGERANLRGFLEFLARPLRAPAATLRGAIDAGRPVALFHHGDLDSVAAATILEHVLHRYLRHPVSVHQSDETIPANALVIALGQDEHVDEDIRLAPRVTRGMTYSIATIAWRLGQLLLMSYETLEDGPFVVVDLETGSDHAHSTELLEVGAVRLAERSSKEGFSSLVRPSGPNSITFDAEHVHGIGWRDVRDAPSPADVLSELLAFIGDAAVIGHNYDEFDGRVLTRLCDDLGLARPPTFTVDTMKLARRLLPDEPHGLESLAQRFGIARRQRHRAAADCDLVAAVFTALLALHREERGLDVLPETLPLVAISIQSGQHQRDENATLILAGARAHHLGQGQSLLARFRERLTDDRRATAVIGHLESSPVGVPEDDERWHDFEQRWREAISAYLSAGGEPTLPAFLHYAALAQPIDDGPEASGRVTMMTIHSAKGAEWPLVFIIGLEDGILPDFRSFDDPVALAEERRVLYVGLTRGKKQVCLLWAAESSGRDRNLSRFLADLSDGLIQHRR